MMSMSGCKCSPTCFRYWEVLTEGSALDAQYSTGRYISQVRREKRSVGRGREEGRGKGRRREGREN